MATVKANASGQGPRSRARRAPDYESYDQGPGLDAWFAAKLRTLRYQLVRATRVLLLLGVLLFGIFLVALLVAGQWPSAMGSFGQWTKARIVGAGVTFQHLEISGAGFTREQDVLAAIGLKPGDTLGDFDPHAAREAILRTGWVADVQVIRLWPDRVVVNLTERQPMAVWQRNGTYTVIDTHGVVIDAAMAREFTDLPLIAGEGAGEAAAEYLDALSAYPAIAERVRGASRVGQRRWDLYLTDGKRIRLPEGNSALALAKLDALQRARGILDFAANDIDLRAESSVWASPAEGGTHSQSSRAQTPPDA